MVTPWAVLATEAAIKAVFGTAVSGLGKSAKGKFSALLTGDPLEAPLRKALNEAFIGFYQTLDAALAFTHSQAERLKDLPNSPEFQSVAGQLPHVPFNKIDPSPLRSAFLALTIEGARETNFEAAWYALGQRFQRAVAQEEELKRYVDLSYQTRQEEREERQIDLLTHLVTLQESAHKAPDQEPVLRSYCEALYRRYRYTDTRGLFMRDVGNVGEKIELHEVFVETYLSIFENTDRKSFQTLNLRSNRNNEREPEEEVDTSFGPPSDSGSTIGDLLQKEQAFVVLGPPGCGKSTLLRSLCLTLCRPLGVEPLLQLDLGANVVPILLPLKEFASELQAKPSLQLHRFIVQRLESTLPQVEQLLTDGRALILLDGLDEVFNDTDRRGVSDECWRMISDYPAARFVITARAHGYKAAPLPGPVPCWQILPFNDTQIERFFLGWFEALARVAPASDYSPKQRARWLTSDVLSMPRLREMTMTPLLCTLTVLVQRSLSGQLPERRAVFYEAAIRTLGHIWEDLKRFPRQRGQEQTNLPDFTLLKRALAEIAWRTTHQLCTSEIPGAFLRKWLVECLAREPYWQGKRLARRVDELLQLIIERIGLILDLGADRYQFLHLSIHEWLVSFFLLDRLNEESRRTVLRHYLHAPGWSEILALLVTGAPYIQAHQLVSDILENPTDEWEKFLRRDLRFIFGCLGDQAPIEPECRAHVIRVSMDALNDPDLIDLIGFINDMSGIGRAPELVPLLLDRLSDRREKVRKAVVGLLAKVGDAATVRPLMLREISSRFAEARCAAIQYFANVEPGNMEARIAIISKLTDKSWLVRQTAEDFFSLIGRDDLSWGTAVQMLKDSYYYQRLAAVKYFTVVGAKSNLTQEAVLQVVGDGNAEVRAAAVEYLSRFSAGNPSLPQGMLQRLRYRNWQERLAAVDFFTQVGELGDTPVRSAMRERLEDEELYIRRRVFEFFARFGVDPITRELFQKKLKSPDWQIRQGSVEFFSIAGIDPETRRLIIEELHDENWRVRRAAADCFAKTQDNSVSTANAILPLLQDDDRRVRQHAVDYFTQIGCRRAEVKEKILALLDDDDPLVRRAAMEFLSRLSDESREVGEAIFRRLDDEDWSLRLAAIEFFARGRDEGISGSLIQKLLDETMRDDWRVRQAVVSLLLRIGGDDPAIQHFFFQRLSDNHPPIRRMAVDYFCRLATEEKETDSTMTKPYKDFCSRLKDDASSPTLKIAAWRFFLRHGFEPSLSRSLFEVFEIYSTEIETDEEHLFISILGKLAATDEDLRAFLLEKRRKMKLPKLDFSVFLTAMVAELDKLRRERNPLTLSIPGLP